MALLEKFDPPAYLSDFTGIPGQLDAWHKAVSAWFDTVADIERKVIAARTERPLSETSTQFYNPARFDPGNAVEQSIPWNAFPKELLRRLGRTEAMKSADTLWRLKQYQPLYDTPTAGNLPYRPQTEYSEWHVRRDADTQAIVHIAFTSEPPEYWQALAGTSVAGPTGALSRFPGNKKLLLQRYRELVGPQVQLDDLFATEDVYLSDGSKLMSKGDYNIYNKWNTTHGIVHLCAPPNSLTAEIQLAGDATISYQNAAHEAVVNPAALICCARYGGPDRNSDPTIGAAVNALARIGAFVTLRNPVGLCMDHIDLSGWAAPDGQPVDDCIRVVRGANKLIARLEVCVPDGRGFAVGDLTIGGERIQSGGQVAECITVHLVGIAAAPGTSTNAVVGCTGRCCVDPGNAVELGRSLPWDKPTPIGRIDALQGEGVLPAQTVPAEEPHLAVAAAVAALRGRRI